MNKIKAVINGMWIIGVLMLIGSWILSTTFFSYGYLVSTDSIEGTYASIKLLKEYVMMRQLFSLGVLLIILGVFFNKTIVVLINDVNELKNKK